VITFSDAIKGACAPECRTAGLGGASTRFIRQKRVFQ